MNDKFIDTLHNRIQYCTDSTDNSVASYSQCMADASEL